MMFLPLSIRYWASASLNKGCPFSTAALSSGVSCPLLQCPVDNFLRLFDRNPQCSQLAELAHLMAHVARLRCLKNIHLHLGLQSAALPLPCGGFAGFGHAQSSPIVCRVTPGVLLSTLPVGAFVIAACALGVLSESIKLLVSWPVARM